MPAELSDTEVFGTGTELSDEQVFGSAPQPAKELSDAEVFGSPSPTPETDKALTDFSPKAIAAARARLGNVPREAMQVDIQDIKAADVPILPKQALPPYWYAKGLEAAFPQSPTAQRVGAGLEGVAELGSEQTTAGNVLMAPFLPEGKAIQRGIGLVFLGQQLIADPQQYKEFLEAKTPEEKIRIATRMIGGHALPTLIMAHSLVPAKDVAATARPSEPPATLTPPEAQTRPSEPIQAQEQPFTAPLETQPTAGGEQYAQQQRETAQVYGDVLDTGRPEESTGEMPAPESGTGVPARGQGEELAGRPPETNEIAKARFFSAGERLRAIGGNPIAVAEELAGSMTRNPTWSEMADAVEAKLPKEDVAVTQPEGGGEPAPAAAPPPAAEPPVQDEPHVSAIANKFVAERAARGEIGEIAPGEGYSTNDLMQGGLKMPPEEITQHISDLMQGTGDPIKQGMAVRAEEARLSKRSADLSKVAEANPNDVNAKIAADNAFKDVQDFHNGPVARVKEIFHATGVGLQGELPVDLSTFNGLREKWLKDNGEAPSPAVESTLRKAAKKVSESVAEDNGARSKLGAELDKWGKELQKSKRRIPTAEDVVRNIMDRMKNEPCKT